MLFVAIHTPWSALVPVSLLAGPDNHLNPALPYQSAEWRKVE
jgi:hypothetical protein